MSCPTASPRPVLPRRWIAPEKRCGSPASGPTSHRVREEPEISGLSRCGRPDRPLTPPGVRLVPPRRPQGTQKRSSPMNGIGVSTVNAYTAHREWASRPSDERYASVQSLYEAARARRLRTEERTIETVALRTQAVEADALALRDTS